MRTTEAGVSPPSAEGATGGPRAKPSRTGRRALEALCGLALGLGLAEAAFRYRDRGAFPHLNVYAPDAQLGVRLEPLASERVALPGNPVTLVRINALGRRGELSAPVPGEIVVVGDSQVFGLGVEEGETASAELGRLLGVPVVNAGVPTYGPLEYNLMVERLLAERRPRAIVYVVNFSNDLFEARHPNTERHAVWDGWAVRKETAPGGMRSFPGRALLFRDSHLVYALRSFWYARGPVLDDQGFRSEGDARDLFDAAEGAAEGRRAAERETEARADARAESLKKTAARELRAEAKLEQVALRVLPDLQDAPLRYAYERSRDNPGDIVYVKRTLSEGERGPDQTFRLIFQGAKVRREVEEKLRALAEEKAKEAEGKAIERTFEEREALRARLAELRDAPREIIRASSPMTPVLERVKQLCDAAGARLFVVALPMDVQVSAAEAAKYGGGADLDMSSTRILLDDLVDSAEALGAVGINGYAALAAAEPGAFLPNDLHMTPRGHRALAAAIAEKVRAAL